MCDEEFDCFCCRFTTMSRVMEPGGCRIASPAWQTKSLEARRQDSQATVNNVLPLMTDSPAFLTRPLNISHSAWMHGTLWNAIFASLIASEIDVIDTLRFNNDVDYLYRLATVLEMRLNHEYWCEPECTWETNSINKTATSWQLGFQTLERYWASFQVTRLSQCNQFFQPGRLLEWRVFHFFIYFLFYFFFLGGGGVWVWGGGGVWGCGGVGVGVGVGVCVWGGLLSSNAFTIWCCIPISRPPRVIRRFKRRSCLLNQMWKDGVSSSTK